MLQIQIERQIKKYTQREIAQLIGISDRGYRKIENGETKPSYDVLVKLEKIFNLSHSELFTQVNSNTKI